MTWRLFPSGEDAFRAGMRWDVENFHIALVSGPRVHLDRTSILDLHGATVVAAQPLENRVVHTQLSSGRSFVTADDVIFRGLPTGRTLDHLLIFLALPGVNRLDGMNFAVNSSGPGFPMVTQGGDVAIGFGGSRLFFLP